MIEKIIRIWSTVHISQRERYWTHKKTSAWLYSSSRYFFFNLLPKSARSQRIWVPSYVYPSARFLFGYMDKASMSKTCYMILWLIFVVYLQLGNYTESCTAIIITSSQMKYSSLHIYIISIFILSPYIDQKIYIFQRITLLITV